MFMFALSIFLASFLLFQIQPLIGKFILPWFGGTTGVWSASLLFFQVLLTCGYAYAHWLSKRFRPKEQGAIHLVVLFLAILVVGWQANRWGVPILPVDSWRPDAVRQPFVWVLMVLTLAVGAPFFLLSTNSTLMQAWFKQDNPEGNPYGLYALSNAGSLVGLLAYPVLVEPNLPLRQQAYYWVIGFAFFVGVAGFQAVRMLRQPTKLRLEPETGGEDEVGCRPGWRDYAIWVVLSALASGLLLATTSKITQEVASIPFLWILPLSVYLFSFILAFSSGRWYPRWFFFSLLALASAAYLWFIIASRIGYLSQLAIYLVLLFACTMLCLGELYRRRPDPVYLTVFYLWISIGGAVGGLIVNLLVPILFKNFWEFQVGLGIVWVLVFGYLLKNRLPVHYYLYRGLTAVAAIGTCLVFGSLYLQANTFTEDAVRSLRNFYGALSIKEKSPESAEDHRFVLTHGVTIHGYQFTQPEKRDLPTAYYVEDSGVGVAFRYHPARPSPLKVGMIGLGVGVLATYGDKGDIFRFYEINPAVIEIAKAPPFSYLSDSQAKITIISGDGRISLENELEQSGSNQFDLIVLDAFNSDSIPTHLLTVEAVRLYQEHLAEDGILAFHISNQFVDLRPVVWKLAETTGFDAIMVFHKGGDVRTKNSRWILLTQSQEFLSNPQVIRRRDSISIDWEPVPLWTDDYSNVFQTLK
jgi:hypothetical protein